MLQKKIVRYPCFLIILKSKNKCCKPKKVKKSALNSQLKTVQVLENDVQMLTLCLPYFNATVIKFVKMQLYETDHKSAQI